MADEPGEANQIRDEVRAATRGLDQSIQRLINVLGWADDFARGRRRPNGMSTVRTPADDEPRVKFLE